MKRVSIAAVMVLLLLVFAPKSVAHAQSGGPTIEQLLRVLQASDKVSRIWFELGGNQLGQQQCTMVVQLAAGVAYLSEVGDSLPTISSIPGLSYAQGNTFSENTLTTYRFIVPDQYCRPPGTYFSASPPTLPLGPLLAMLAALLVRRALFGRRRGMPAT